MSAGRAQTKGCASIPRTRAELTTFLRDVPVEFLPEHSISGGCPAHLNRCPRSLSNDSTIAAQMLWRSPTWSETFPAAKMFPGILFRRCFPRHASGGPMCPRSGSPKTHHPRMNRFTLGNGSEAWLSDVAIPQTRQCRVQCRRRNRRRRGQRL